MSARWMSGISDDKSLSQLCIPGTHDSLSYNASGRLLTCWVRCQNKNIGEQLDMGVRFLDIRVDRKWGGKHGDSSVPHNFGHVMEYVKNFLSANPKETILMRIKQDCSNGKQKDFNKGFDNHIKPNIGLFWKRNGKHQIPTLGEARGKIVVFSQMGYDNNALYTFHDIGLKWNDHGMFDIQDTYNDEHAPEGAKGDKFVDYKFQLVVDQIEKAHEQVINSGKKDKYFMNFVSAVGHNTGIVKRHPGWFNDRLKPMVNGHLDSNPDKFTGILIRDFITGGCAGRIFNRNK